MYEYFFYKLYKSLEISSFVFWSDWKASLLMDFLVSCIIFSINIFYTVITKKTPFLFTSKVTVMFFLIPIVLFNFLMFNYNNKWKLIIKEFDAWPKKKNTVGGVVAWSVMLLIFSNVIFMFYLMSQIDWKQYK
jgi:hypothetical protein